MRRFSAAEWADHAKLYGDVANKFMRTFTTQVEVLAKLRRGSAKIIKHVYVQQGG